MDLPQTSLERCYEKVNQMNVMELWMDILTLCRSLESHVEFLPAQLFSIHPSLHDIDGIAVMTDTVETGQSACNLSIQGKDGGTEDRGMRTVVIDQCNLIVAHEPGQYIRRGGVVTWCFIRLTSS